MREAPGEVLLHAAGAPRSRSRIRGTAGTSPGDAQPHRHAEQALEFETGVGQQALDAVAVAVGHRLVAVHGERQQRLAPALAVAQLQGQEALVLVEGGGKG